jgi:outer membrane protein assembly factor BamB
MTYQDPRGPRPPQYSGGPYGPPPQGGYPPPGPAQPGPMWQPPTPPGSPRSDGRRARRVAVTAIVAVVVVAAAGAVFFWTRGGGGDSAGSDTPAGKEYEAGVKELGAAEVVWRTEQGVAPEAVGADDYWLTDEHLVRRLPGRVVAYEMKTGKEAWEFPVGKVEDGRCPSSVEHSNLRVALLVATENGVSHACEKLTVLDIGTGKEVFTTDLPPVDGQKVMIDVPVVFGENVVIANEAGTRVLDINNGAVRSMPDPESACKSQKVALVGDVLLANAYCDNGEETSMRLRSYDANLQPVWEWETPAGADGEQLPVLGVLSLDPLVVEVGHSGHDTQLMRVDPKSGQTVPISEYTGGVRGKYMSACDDWSMGVCEMAKVVDNKVILMTTPVQINPDDPEASPGMQSTEHRNELVAFDLNTGKEAWRTGLVGGRSLALVPTADGSVAAYQSETPNGSKGILFSVDPAAGKLAPLLPIGPKAHEDDKLNDHLRSSAFRGDNQLAIWRDDLLIIFKAVHRDSTTGEADTVAFALPD